LDYTIKCQLTSAEKSPPADETVTTFENAVELY
jgi:hypothetical protein